MSAGEQTILFEEGEDGFWIATIPEVPGAFSQGKTKTEARENVIDALYELMAARRDLPEGQGDRCARGLCFRRLAKSRDD